jgi:hypothetical protein
MKIDLIFQTAIKENHDSIVLKSFTSPIYQATDIFNQCLKKWSKYFRKIIFSIQHTDTLFYFSNSIIYHKQITQNQ